MGDLTPNISLHEVIPRREYVLVKAGTLPPFNIVDMRIINAAQKFIDTFGTTIINNWMDKGNLEFCGYRPYDYTDGAKYSLHRSARALDLHPQKISVAEVFAAFYKNQKLFYDWGVRIVEDQSMTPGWIHIAVADTDRPSILMVKP